MRADSSNAKLREILITTKKPGEVLLASVSVYNNHAGLTYNSVGYVGATIGVLNKLDQKLLASDLTRINPRIVVLSFGTNEAANDDLDLVKYTRTYEAVIKKIQESLPDATIVIISPPDFNRIVVECAKNKIASATCRPPKEMMSDSWNVGMSRRPHPCRCRRTRLSAFGTLRPNWRRFGKLSAIWQAITV
jgi:hypothetical protein